MSNAPALGGIPVISPYQQLEFEALQQVTVTMVPQFYLPALNFMSGRVGPFIINYPVTVPLWLALYFRSSNMCTIIPPPALAVPELQRMLEVEKTQDHFTEVPYHFFTFARLLLAHAAADIPHAEEVHRLVNAWRMCRDVKLNKQVASGLEAHLLMPMMQIANLTAIEVETVRAALAPALNDGAYLVQASREAHPRRAFAAPAPTAPLRSTTVASSQTPSAALASPARPSDGDTYIGTTGPAEESAAPAIKRRRTLRQR